MRLHGEKGNLEDLILKFAMQATSMQLVRRELSEELYAAIRGLFTTAELRRLEDLNIGFRDKHHLLDPNRNGTHLDYE